MDDDFRRPFESWLLHLEDTSDAYMEPGTGCRFEEIYQLLLRIKKFKKYTATSGSFPLTPQTVVLRAALTEIVSTFHLLHELNRRASTRYDITIPTNEKKLLEVVTFVFLLRFGSFLCRMKV